MITVSGRKRHPVIHVCSDMEEAEVLRAQLIAAGYKNVRMDQGHKT